MSFLTTLRTWARAVKRDAVMLWFAQRHRDTPVAARVVCALAVAYALSPIDLIPDFIPVLGFVDDAILLPGLIWLAVRLLPPAVVAECRRDAEQWLAERGAKPRSMVGLALIVALWAAAAYAAWRYFT
ncbi:DUF1232 domain-containing protein [Oxalobacteraceae bacterium OM1]|nr:DUF1232 domain-containing protein [Oxalobacteraceae bacterium OM1]